MTQKPQIQLPNTKPTAKTTNSSPSVPISLYRQVVGDLEATQARMETIQLQNQRLVQENKQLRQEIDGVLKLAQHLQKFVVTLDRPEDPRYRPIIPAPQRPPQNKRNNELESPLTNEPTPSDPIIEIEEKPINNYDQDNKTKAINGWFLAIAIILITLTALSMAFILIRPLLNQNQK